MRFTAIKTVIWFSLGALMLGAVGPQESEAALSVTGDDTSQVSPIEDRCAIALPYRIPLVLLERGGYVEIHVEISGSSGVAGPAYWANSDDRWVRVEPVVKSTREIQYRVPADHLQARRPIAFVATVEELDGCDGRPATLPPVGHDLLIMDDTPYDSVTRDVADQTLARKISQLNSTVPSDDTSSGDLIDEVCAEWFLPPTPCDVLQYRDPNAIGNLPEPSAYGEEETFDVVADGDISISQAQCESVTLEDGRWIEGRPPPSWTQSETGETVYNPSYDQDTNTVTVYQHSRNSWTSDHESFHAGARVGMPYRVRHVDGEAGTIPVRIELTYHSGGQLFAAAGPLIWDPRVIIASSAVGDSATRISAGHNRLTSDFRSIDDNTWQTRYINANHQYTGGFFPTPPDRRTLTPLTTTYTWERTNLIFDQLYATFAQAWTYTFAEAGFNSAARGEVYMDRVDEGWYLRVPQIRLTALDGWVFVC